MRSLTWLVAALLLTTACARAGTPPTKDVEHALLKSDKFAGGAIADDQAKCVAHVYAKSDLSADYLNAVIKGAPPTKISTHDRRVLAGLSSKIASECLK